MRMICTECGVRFFGDGTSMVCQDCAGTTPDQREGLEKDRQNILKVNKTYDPDEPSVMQIDPREPTKRKPGRPKKTQESSDE